MKHIEVFSRDNCPFCDRAKSLLNSKGVDFDVIDITNDEIMAIKMMQRSEQRTVPQIFIDNQSIGGYDALARLNAQGTLNKMLGIHA